MNEALKTLEGSYCLHLFYKINWPKWRQLATETQATYLDEFEQLQHAWTKEEEIEGASHTIYSIIGGKADLVLFLVRPTLNDIQREEARFAKMPISDYLDVTYSYVSVIELSNYLSKDAGDPYQIPEIRARLFPTLPNTEYICFYPMNKKRDGQDNWYMLSMDERRQMMALHGKIGRGYAGKVKQFISGSIGFDDYEWGVTLFSDDSLQFKKLIYEMRFDEVSARYGEFGSFYVGVKQSMEERRALLL